MTKVEMFEALKAMANKAGETDIVIMLDKEIASLRKRNSKAKEIRSIERDRLKSQVIQGLTNATEALTTMAIATLVGVSPQKITPVLADLLDEKQIAITPTDKKNAKKTYTLAEVA